MLNTIIDNRSQDLIFRSRIDDPKAYPAALGCGRCPLRALCGGLSIREPIIECLDFCCGNAAACTRVCRNNSERYVEQLREINGFSLDTVDRAPVHSFAFKNGTVPLIYHGSSRAKAFPGDVFALRLSDLVNFKKRELIYQTREQLCQAFKIDYSANIILSGVNHDRRVEPWWTLTESRIAIMTALKALGIAVVTVPNFSLLLDNPRTDDLHAMKRIAILFSEFQNAGLPTALHPNSRTLKDFERWSAFIAARNEIEIIAYEFITGSGSNLRMQFHLDGLARLATDAGRNLDIIVRGTPKVIPFLQRYFRSVVHIDTMAFMKTLKRRRAKRVGNNLLEWPAALTQNDEVVDELLIHNEHERRIYLQEAFFTRNNYS